MQGLYLNTPPKPKQAKTEELTGGRAAEAGGRQQPGVETKENEEKESSELEAAMEWKPGSPLVAEREGAHGDLELDQQGWPGSCSSGAVGHSVAQEVIVAIGT